MPIIISFRKDIVIEVGAIDKSFLYDNIGRKVNKSNQVKYLIKQSRKIQQSPENTVKKQRKFLSSKEVSEINYILQSDYEQINLIRHQQPENNSLHLIQKQLVVA